MVDRAPYILLECFVDCVAQTSAHLYPVVSFAQNMVLNSPPIHADFSLSPLALLGFVSYILQFFGSVHTHLESLAIPGWYISEKSFCDVCLRL